MNGRKQKRDIEQIELLQELYRLADLFVETRDSESPETELRHQWAWANLVSLLKEIKSRNPDESDGDQT